MRIDRRLVNSSFSGVLAFLLSLTACYTRVPGTIPEADIVFQTGWRDGDPDTLGFIDADGSNLAYVEIRSPRGFPALPTWTPDGGYLLFRSLHNIGYVGDLYAMGPNGRLISYPTDVAFGEDSAAITMDGRSFVIHEAGDSGGIEHLYLLDIKTGEIEETYVTESKLRAGVEVGNNALSDSTLVYVYGELVDDETRDRLISRNLDTGQETTLVSSEMMFKPSISPDGRWVAYTAQDGIYLVSSEGGESRRVVNTAVERETGGGLWLDDSPPAVSWSPDSRWMVYHRCVLPGLQYCYQHAHYSIFKVNVDTAQETLLVERALYPYWRLRPELTE